jgi:hypothetical protein
VLRDIFPSLNFSISKRNICMCVKIFKNLIATTVLILISACGGGSSDDNVVLVNKTETISEGASLSYSIDVGSYTAEVTSSNNGVIMSWIGGSACAGSGEVKIYSGSCTMAMKGQFIIRNPTVFGLGGSEIVTIKLTKK